MNGWRTARRPARHHIQKASGARPVGPCIACFFAINLIIVILILRVGGRRGVGRTRIRRIIVVVSIVSTSGLLRAGGFLAGAGLTSRGRLRPVTATGVRRDLTVTAVGRGACGIG